ITLPDNALYTLTPNSPQGYLITTDPQFANYRTWLGSDYMLSHLASDPNYTQKRLGDGFYEQQLIRDQMVQLTGSQFMAGYSDGEAQYQALMDSGLAASQSLQLSIGVALSADQVAQLT